jgi:homoserine O-acetyltransferase
MKKFGLLIVLLISLACTGTVFAQGYPAPKEGDWIAKDFRFHADEVIPELRVHYTTVGVPSGEPVVILHGTQALEPVC